MLWSHFSAAKSISTVKNFLRQYFCSDFGLFSSLFGSFVWASVCRNINQVNVKRWSYHKNFYEIHFTKKLWRKRLGSSCSWLLRMRSITWGINFERNCYFDNFDMIHPCTHVSKKSTLANSQISLLLGNYKGDMVWLSAPAKVAFLLT